MYANRKDLIKDSIWLSESEAGKKTLKFVIKGLLLTLVLMYFLIAGLTWLKHGLTLDGFYINLARLIVLTFISVLYFYLMFKDLFFSKDNNNEDKPKPFSIV